MANELLKLTAQIVMSHASVSELSPAQLVDEIKEVYALLASLEEEMPAEGAVTAAMAKEPAAVRKPSVPLDQIVTEKYVICLECQKKFRTLKGHLRKAHHLTPAEYHQRYGLDPKKYPLVCKEYSEHRSRLAKEKGLGVKGGRRKKA